MGHVMLLDIVALLIKTCLNQFVFNLFNFIFKGTRVSLDGTTLTIMRILPREVDPLIYKMSHEDPGNISYAEIGGLAEEIRQVREIVELPLINPELFKRVGINPPKGCLLFGPPGTGKTLLAR